ncbi:MAG: PEP-utilizing enzyme, partial [Candidatus Diapherotrites archaeon]|nr:PEP-utilizing enzyme [Candidatus Diapherotrites archaeon]
MAKNNWTPLTSGKGHIPFFTYNAFVHAIGKPIKEFPQIKNISKYRRVLNISFVEENDFKNFTTSLQKAEKEKPGTLIKTAHEWEKRLLNLKKFTDENSEKRFSEMSNKKLLEFFKDFFLHCEKAIQFELFYYGANSFLPEQLLQELNELIKNKSELGDVLLELTEIDRELSATKERKKLIELTKFVVQKSKDFENSKVKKRIAKHLQEFSFLGYYWCGGKPYNSENIKERIMEYLEKDLDKELHMCEKWKSVDEKIKKIAKKYSLTKSILLKAEAIRNYAYVSTLTNEIFGSYMVFGMQKMFAEISKRLYISVDQFIEADKNEIITALQKEKIPKDLNTKLQERVKDYYFEFYDGKLYFFGENEINKVKKQMKQNYNELKKLKEVQGLIAKKGIITGRARIILSPQELHSLQRGEILVSINTTPVFVPAMEKCSAIVTDEGGLLSHAAIVSRELGKPCIVGTKIATKVFSNGELIEVNAEKGIVKK